MSYASHDAEVGNYHLRLHEVDPSRLIVSFGSAGAGAAGEPVEEFRKTLLGFGVSMLFVTDRRASWYSHDNTAAFFAQVADITARFTNVGLIGESMGACGALVFTQYSTHVSRLLGFSPQYSLMPPYVLFDPDLAAASERIRAACRLPLHNFSHSPIAKRCQLVYGTTDWADHIHASMYSAAGFSTTRIQGAGHRVAMYLKTGAPKNLLRALIERFCDFSQEFGRQDIQAIAASFLGTHPLTHGCEPDASHSWERRRSDPVAQPTPPPFPNLALRKPARQSSTSQWSRHPDIVGDATGAVDGVIDGEYSFHTAREHQPWWMVDLGRQSAIAEIRLYNRMTNFPVACQARHFEIRVSDDAIEWLNVFTKTDQLVFGGADGYPYIHSFPDPPKARFVQVRLLETNCLHLDQVEVYGSI